MKARATTALLIASLLPAAAFASSSFNLDRLTLNPGGESLVLDSGDGLQAGHLRATLATQYQHDPLVYREGNTTVGALVGYRFSAHLAAAYGVTDWFEAGLELPLILTQGGDDILGSNPVQATAVGAPRLQGRFTFLREASGAPVDFGLTLGVSLPLGAENALTRDPGMGFGFTPRLAGGKKIGSLVRLGLEAGATLREEAVLSPFSIDPKADVGSELVLGLVASTLGDGLRGELSVLAHMPFGDAPVSADLLGGLRYPFLTAGLEAYALAGPGLGASPGTPLFRVVAGVAYAPAPRDTAPSCEAERSCPHMDLDGDGIVNAADACPATYGLAELQGCPDQDDDGDGVPNLSDRCPTEAGSAEHAGCPAPDVPDAPDADGDGLADDVDLCPNEAGPAKGDGCPEPAREPEPAAAVEGEIIAIDETIQFAMSQAKILEVSFDTLSKLAALLQARPEISLLRIEGHTDSTGRQAANLSLSKARAESVKTFLVGKGVAAERLEAVGVGGNRPIASNEDAAGRAQNRRVEFVVVRVTQ